MTQKQQQALRKKITDAVMNEIIKFKPTAEPEEAVSIVMSFVANFLGSVAQVEGFQEKEFIKGIFSQALNQVDNQQ